MNTFKIFIIMYIISTTSHTTQCMYQPFDDESFEDMFKGTKKDPLQAPTPAAEVKKPSLLRSKKAQTAQDREEISLLQTFDELQKIAEGLINFTGSKETDDIVKVKKEIQGRKEQKAEQDRKQRERSSRSPQATRGSSSGYGSQYGGGGRYPSGGSSYWGGGSGGYGGGRTSPWAGGGYSSPYAKSGNAGAYDTDNYDDGISSSDKKSKKDKRNDGDFGTQQKDKDAEDKKKAEKDALPTYNKLVQSTKEAANELAGIIDTIKDLPEKNATEMLMNQNAFNELNKKLSVITETKKSLDVDMLKKLEGSQGNKFAKEQGVLDGHLKKIFPYTLLAATVDDSDGLSTVEDKPAAVQVLKSPTMTKNIDTGKLEKRGKKLFNQWFSAAEKTKFNTYKNNALALEKNNFDITTMTGKSGWTDTIAGTPQNLNTTKTYFKEKNDDLKKITANFPYTPASIQNKQQEITDIRSRLNEAP